MKAFWTVAVILAATIGLFIGREWDRPAQLSAARAETSALRQEIAQIAASAEFRHRASLYLPLVRAHETETILPESLFVLDMEDVNGKKTGEVEALYKTTQSEARKMNYIGMVFRDGILLRRTEIKYYRGNIIY